MSPRVLGIDPGTLRLGWGLIQGESRPSLVSAGCCQAPSRLSVPQRLVQISEQLARVLEDAAPDHLAMETSFHGKNPQALLRLGEARGMVIAVAGRHRLEVVDYTPAAVKKAVTGRGNSSKEGVARMVQALLRPSARPREQRVSTADRAAEASENAALAEAPLDVTDALAVALCHVHHMRWRRSTEQARTSPRRNTGRR